MPLAAFIELIQHPTVAVSNADGLQAKWATRETEAETEAGDVTGNLRGPQCPSPRPYQGIINHRCLSFLGGPAISGSFGNVGEMWGPEKILSEVLRCQYCFG